MTDKERKIKEAAEKWVREFNSIEYTLVEESMNNDIDDWFELTRSVIIEGDYVTYLEDYNQYKVIEVRENTVIIDYEVENIEIDKEQAMCEPDTMLPMWGTLWTFGEGLDEDWCRDNLDIMKQCGFRVYEYQKTGTLYFGIDGAGYDFYEQHWIPLYKERGLKWHE